MSSSALNRLRTLFKTAKPAITRPTKTPKPTATASAVDVSPPSPQSTVESKEKGVKIAKTTTTRRTKTSKPIAKATASAVNVSPDLTGESKEEQFRAIVNKFKKSCDSPRFRRDNSRLYQKTVLRLANAQKFSHIEEILEYQKKFEDITKQGFTVCLIGLYGRAGMYDHARKLFDEMPQLNCPRTLRSFNALLDACVNSGKYDEISKLMTELPDKLSIEPDIVSYNTVLKALCKKGTFEKALLVLDKMEENGLQPDVISFNTVLDSLYQNGMFAEAEKVWTMMKDNNVVPNVRSYNSMLRGLIGDDRLAEAVKSYEEMISKEIKPDIFTFNALIKGCCEKGDLEEAGSWYETMEKESCSPDMYTFILLVQLACDKCDFVYGLELCKEAIRRLHFLKPYLLQLVVDGLVKDSKMEEAKELVELGKSNKDFRYELEIPSAE